jgi:hypothetical protein
MTFCCDIPFFGRGRLVREGQGETTIVVMVNVTGTQVARPESELSLS